MATIEPYVQMIDAVYSASLQLKTMSDDKDGNRKQIVAAREKIAAAEYVFVLGYGFDPLNSERIQLQKLRQKFNPNLERVSFTNFEDSNKINKRAGPLFSGTSASPFLAHQPPIYQLYEKSVRDVYGALSLDFEFP